MKSYLKGTTNFSKISVMRICFYIWEAKNLIPFPVLLILLPLLTNYASITNEFFFNIEFFLTYKNMFLWITEYCFHVEWIFLDVQYKKIRVMCNGIYGST